MLERAVNLSRTSVLLSIAFLSGSTSASALSRNGYNMKQIQAISVSEEREWINGGERDVNLQCFLDMLDGISEGVVFADIVLKEMVSSSSSDDLVINVSDVHHIDNVVVEVATQNSTEDVKCDVGPGMAHV